MNLRLQSFLYWTCVGSLPKSFNNPGTWDEKIEASRKSIPIWSYLPIVKLNPQSCGGHIFESVGIILCLKKSSFNLVLLQLVQFYSIHCMRLLIS